MSKISVAMATYNGEKYIVRQLESIRAQTRPIDEVVIVDDCSTDRTVSLITDYIEKNQLDNWKIEKNTTNLGYKKNFWKCISKTTGDYIFLSDQDDEWCKNKIADMMQVVSEDAKILALSCAVQIIDANSNEIEIKCEKNYYNSNFLYLNQKPKKVELFDLSYIGKHNISPGCTTLITRTLANQFMSLYDFELPHDWFLNMLAASESGCSYLNKKLIRYRVHGDNAIGANTGAINGIKAKSREVRIEDYKSRNNALRKIAKGNVNIDSVLELNEEMISFYQNPSIKKLIKLRRNPSYYELAKRKVRIWELAIALGLDKMIIRVLK